VVTVSSSPQARPLPPLAAHALLHFTVFVWGFTAILGRSISLPAITLVWYRLILVVAVMAGLVRWNGGVLRVPRAQAARWLAIGALVAVHWLLFYGCIKYAGVAVAVLCLSTVTFFTALFEPLVFRRAPKWGELLIGASVVVGVSLLVKLETQTTPLGLAMGIGSALFSSAFGTINGKLAHQASAELLSTWELGGALLTTTLAFALWPHDFVPPGALSWRDAGLVTVLAIGCTVLPWLWNFRVLRTVSPYTVALAVSLEPVYSMGLAYFIFPDEEQLTWRFYLGAALLVVLVVTNGWLKAPKATPQKAD
jgi:drug/metabolite transporter (DMT)-like permease